jgi:hypothetical protein
MDGQEILGNKMLAASSIEYGNCARAGIWKFGAWGDSKRDKGGPGQA